MFEICCKVIFYYMEEQIKSKGKNFSTASNKCFNIFGVFRDRPLVNCLTSSRV